MFAANMMTSAVSPALLAARVFGADPYNYTEEERAFEMLYLFETAAPFDLLSFFIEEFQSPEAALLEEELLRGGFLAGSVCRQERKDSPVEIPAHAGGRAVPGETERSVFFKAEKLPFFVLPESVQSFSIHGFSGRHAGAEAEHEQQGEKCGDLRH
jgi:hypothetical protein